METEQPGCRQPTRHEQVELSLQLLRPIPISWILQASQAVHLRGNGDRRYSGTQAESQRPLPTASPSSSEVEVGNLAMHSFNTPVFQGMRRELRIWLVERTPDQTNAVPVQWIQQTGPQASFPVLIIGKAPLRSDFVPALTKLVPDLLDLIVVEPGCRPSSVQLESLLLRGAGVLAICQSGECADYLALAARHPLTVMLPPASPADFQLALMAAHAALVRHRELVAEVGRLKQRLQDRVLLERAKAVLIRQIGLTEEDAYHWLRLLSRRERRPLRDVAQSLLETPDMAQQRADLGGVMPAPRPVSGTA